MVGVYYRPSEQDEKVDESDLTDADKYLKGGPDSFQWFPTIG